MGHSDLTIMWLAPAIIFSANKPQNKRWILPWYNEQNLRCYILDSKRKTKMASGSGINRPNMDLFIMFCIPVSMQRAASRSVTWVIWSGDSSMWTQPTFPSNSNWWTQKTDSKKRDKTPKRRQKCAERAVVEYGNMCSMQVFFYINTLCSNLLKK